MEVDEAVVRPPNVRALRDQLQNKLFQAQAQQNGGPSKPNFRRAVPIRDAPLPPPHRGSNASLSTRSSSSSISDELRRSKPPVAPKPASLRSAAERARLTPPLPSPPPLIRVQTVDSTTSTLRDEEDIEVPRRTSVPDHNELSLLRLEHTEAVDGWNRSSENGCGSGNGGVGGTVTILSRRCTTIFETTSRPNSTISTASSVTSADTAQEAKEDMDLSDSDLDSEDEGKQRRTRRINSTLSERFSTITDRRPSCGTPLFDSALHDQVMQELSKKNLLRSSARANHNNNNGGNSNSNHHSEIPHDVGRVRTEKKTRPATVSASSLTSGADSVSSNRSSSTGVSSSSASSGCILEPEVPEYDTGDHEEDKRLKKLHYAAKEFLTVEEKFVKYLDYMGNVYPNYLAEYGRQTGRDVIPSTANGPNIVDRLKVLILQILPAHETMLAEFTRLLTTWDSEHPNMSDVVNRLAPYLKVCKPFLKEKAQLLQGLTEAMNHSDFRIATTSFEDKVFRRGLGAVTQQLDQVHQNFMRYKILMVSYCNYLKEDSEEWRKAKATISNIEKIAQDVNRDLDMPSNSELLRLWERFRGEINVFKPGVRLIRQGEVLKQTRRDVQARYLVLFSETLWLCREESSGVFDLDRSYDIPIDTIRTEVVRHDDFDKLLRVKSQKRSFTILFKTPKERDDWDVAICGAVRDFTAAKNRIKAATRRTSASVAPENGTPAPSECWSPEPASDNADSVSEGPSEPNQNSGEAPPRDFDEDQVQAAWIPDESATRCLMQGCDTEFNFFHRRHHCRDCGWLICSKCVAKAPLVKKNFHSENVCPECYDRIWEIYQKGGLFPASRTRTINENTDDMILFFALPEFETVKKTSKAGPFDFGTVLRSETKKWVNVNTLFNEPKNMHLKRMDVEARIREKEGLVFGRVYLRKNGGQEVVKYALLTDNMLLSFYAAVYDKDPEDQHIIYGFTLKEYEASIGGTYFELRHRNQIKTDRSEDLIVFRVEKESSRKKWSLALRKGLGLPIDEIDE